MLNTVLLRENFDALWAPDRPIWEEDPKTYWEQTQMRENIMIDNFAGLLTVPTRKIELFWNSAKQVVLEYKIAPGNKIKAINGDLEPFAAWTKKGDQPKRFQRNLASRQTWREFPKFFIGSNGEGIPCLIKWLQGLKDDCYLPSKRLMTFCTSSIQFKTMNSVVQNVYTDDFTFYADLLSERERSERSKVETEIKTCEAISKLIELLIFWRMGIIECPLFERDISADKI